MFTPKRWPWACGSRWCPPGSCSNVQIISCAADRQALKRNAPVLEAAVDVSEVSHAAGTGRVPSLGLLAPLVCWKWNASIRDVGCCCPRAQLTRAKLGRGEAARGALLVLLVERAAAAATAQTVRDDRCKRQYCMVLVTASRVLGVAHVCDLV